MPPQKQPPAPRDTEFSRGVIAFVLTIIVGLALFFGIIIPLIHSFTPTPGGIAATSDTPGPFPPTEIPPTAAPTTASSSQLVSTAALGGTLDAFTAKYGPQTGEITWLTSIAGRSVLLGIDLSHASDATDGTPRAYVVAVQVPIDRIGAQSWTPATAATIVAAFLPRDAHHQRNVAASNGATDHIYSSASLAKTFAAVLFTNDLGTLTVPRGTLHWQCFGQAAPAPNVDECLITVGVF